MNNFEIDEIQILSETRPQQYEEPVDSNFQRNISMAHNTSISIPMASLDPYERQPNLAGHTDPIVLMSGSRVGNPSQNSIVVAENAAGENVTERSGQLGLCNDPYCTTCPTYYKVYQQSKPRASTIFDPKFRNSLYGNVKGFWRKRFSLCFSCIPGVINPHTKIVQQWNMFLAIMILIVIIIDPLFFFLIYVKKDDKCIVIDWTIAKTLVLLRSTFDVMYFLNILLQFRLTYIAPESRVVGAVDLVDVPKKIVVHYLQSYFLADLSVVLPLPQIMMIALPLGSSGANYAMNLLPIVIFGQYIPRLFRFLPLLIAQSPFERKFETVLENLTMSLLRLMLLGHVIGSCWYLFGLKRVNQCLRDACHHSNLPGCKDLIDCDTKSGNISATLWSEDKGAGACLNPTSGASSYGIYVNVVPLTMETQMINKYTYALFWGLQQLSTLAGNQTPSHFVWEVLFTIFIIVLGLYFLAILIGDIQSFTQSLGWRSLEMLSRGRDAEQWMSNRRLPEELKRRVRLAQRYNWSVTRGVSEKMVLENLPDDLLKDIRRHLFGFIRRVPIFTLMDDDEPIILDVIHERLKHMTYSQGSTIYSQGSVIQKMVFIVRGRLESIREDGISVPLSIGDVCGEELLISYIDHSSECKEGKKVNLQRQGLISDRTVRCLTNVEAFLLHMKDIEEVTTLFERFLRSPHAQGVIRYCSPYWRSLAVKTIQVAWRRYKKCLSRGKAIYNNGAAKVTFYLYE